MTVAQLREQMPNREYVQWQAYLARKHQREELARQMMRR